MKGGKRKGRHGSNFTSPQVNYIFILGKVNQNKLAMKLLQFEPEFYI